MKRLQIITVALLFVSSVSFAQKTSFGIKGGVNQSTFYLKGESPNESRLTLDKPGFHVGGVADIGVSSNFSVQPQLLLQFKGGKLKQSGSETQFDFMTIDVPVNLVYHHQGFFFGAGPNFSVGLSGKGKVTGQPDKDLYEEGVISANSEFKRFDIGANVMMGYQFPSGFTVGANWTPGLMDIYDDDADNIKASNSVIGFSIGYMFSSGKMVKKK